MRLDLFDGGGEMSLLEEPVTARPSESDTQVLFPEARARRRRLRIIRAIIVTSLAGALLFGMALGGVFTPASKGGFPASKGGSGVSAGIAGPFGAAYVTSTSGILPVDLQNGTTGRPIKVPEIGKNGVLALAPNGKTAFVISGRGLVPIDLTTRTLGTPIPIPTPSGISSMVIAPNGRIAYVTTFKGVDSINLVTGSVDTLVAMQSASSIAITPSGKTAYVAVNDAVIPLDLATRALGTPITGPNIAPGTIAISPNGRAAYVTNGRTVYGSVTPIELASRSAPRNLAGRGSPVSSRVLRLEMTSGQPTLTIWATVLPGWDDYDHLFSADAALEASGAITGTGPAAMRAFDQIWTTAAPDFTITPLMQVATGGQVMSENLAEGTHHGVLALPAGPVPATGDQFGGKYAGVFEIADGKIAAQRVYFDRMAVAEQLGLLPAPASTTA